MRSLKALKISPNGLMASRPCLKEKRYGMLLMEQDLNPPLLLKPGKEIKTILSLQKSLNKMQICIYIQTSLENVIYISLKRLFDKYALR